MDLYFRFCNIEISEEHVLALAAGVDALIAERESKTDNTKSNVDRKKLEELEEKYKKELRAEKAEAKDKRFFGLHGIIRRKHILRKSGFC